MKYLMGVLGALSFAVLIAACSSGTSNIVGTQSTSPPTITSGTTQNYDVTTTSQFTLAAPSLGGNGAVIQFNPATSGASEAMMSVSTMSSAPPGIAPLSKARLPASLRYVKDFSYAAEWFYQVVSTPSLTFSMLPTWTISIQSPVSGAGYFMAYYDPTVPGWNIYAGGTAQSTAVPVPYQFTPAALPSPFTVPTPGGSGALFALVAITGTTPTPVPTPTPIPSYPNLIADGNFQTEGTNGAFTLNSSTGWTPCANANPAETPSPRPTSTMAPMPSIASALTGVSPAATPYAGVKYAALTGRVPGTGAPDEPRGIQGICQAITIPSNPALWFEVLEGGNDAGSGTYVIGQRASVIVGGTLSVMADSTPSDPYYEVTGGTDVPLYQDYICTGQGTGQSYNNCTGTPVTPAWVEKGPYTTILQPYEGQSAVLFIGVYSHGGDSGNNYGVYTFIDNVSLVNIP